MKKFYALCRHLGSSASAGLPWLPPAEALTPDYDLSEVPPCSVAYENPQTPFLFFYVQRRQIELPWEQNAEPETYLRLFQPAISDTLHSFFITINSPSSSKTWYVIMRQHCPNRNQDSPRDGGDAHGGLKIATCNILASNLVCQQLETSCVGRASLLWEFGEEREGRRQTLTLATQMSRNWNVAVTLKSRDGCRVCYGDGVARGDS